jgi:cytoskeletal protein RodZ
MTENNEHFKTHIKEPRWQQVVSIIIVLGILGVWLWFGLHGH